MTIFGQQLFHGLHIFFEKHWKAMDESRPEAMDYIRQNHKRTWTRSQFLTHCKVDYVTNNLVQ
jgi:hypothetical protein